MAVLVGHLTSVGDTFDFSRFFARQPEPDLEFTEEELDQTTSTRPISPMKPPKKSGGGRPLLWIFLLILLGGIGYIAMEPEQLTEWLAPFLGETTPPQSGPPVAMQPRPSMPSPTVPSPTTPPPGESSSLPSSDPLTTAPPSVPAAPTQPPASTAPVHTTSSPLFAEGQRVTVVGNPTAPAEMIPMTLDAAGNKPGPTLRPGTALSVLDGDLQPGGWVYSVRTEDGVKGWIPERRLRLKF